MKRQIGRKVFTLGKRYWSYAKWGIIVGIGNDRYYIVKYPCGRKAWIRKNEILFWN